MRVPGMGLTCALAILAGSMNVGPARAQSLADRYAAEIDTDHDGAISRAEYAAMTRSHFARYDLDKDGRLSGAERPPYMVREGSTTEAEYLETSLRVFDSQDGDHDGRIAGDEVARFWANLNSGQPAK